MSMDHGPGQGLDNPVAGISPPKKSKAKFWIFGGLGCLGIVGLCCVGAMAGFWFYGMKPTMDFMNENATLVESDPQVQELLGAPVKCTPGPPVQNPSDPTKLTFSGTAAGENGSGRYVVEAQMDGFTPVRNEMYLEFNGEKINLDADAPFDLQIDDGSGGGEDLN